jgi:predicted nucleic acid-binding Zn ribbon protein
MIQVFMATFAHKCVTCSSTTLIYKVVLGDLSFYLCEECASRLYRALEATVIVPDVREW